MIYTNNFYKKTKKLSDILDEAEMAVTKLQKNTYKENRKKRVTDKWIAGASDGQKKDGTGKDHQNSRAKN